MVYCQFSSHLISLSLPPPSLSLYLSYLKLTIYISFIHELLTSLEYFVTVQILLLAILKTFNQLRGCTQGMICPHFMGKVINFGPKLN